MSKPQKWNPGKEIMRKQIDKAKKGIKREIGRKGKERQKGKEKP